MEIQTTALELGKAIGDAAATIILGRLCAAILLIIITIWVVSFIRNRFGFGMDATDLNARTRSGMVILTDYETGVQYLATNDGGLTPRLGQDGKPIVSSVHK